MTRQQYAWQRVQCPFCRRIKEILVDAEDELLRRSRKGKTPRKECDDCYCARIDKEQAAAYIRWRNAVCPEQPG